MRRPRSPSARGTRNDHSASRATLVPAATGVGRVMTATVWSSPRASSFTFGGAWPWVGQRIIGGGFRSTASPFTVSRVTFIPPVISGIVANRGTLAA
jgi:hypothetical protein